MLCLVAYVLLYQSSQDKREEQQPHDGKADLSSPPLPPGRLLDDGLVMRFIHDGL